MILYHIELDEEKGGSGCEGEKEGRKRGSEGGERGKGKERGREGEIGSGSWRLLFSD